MPSAPPQPKVTVALEIKTMVEISDEGYLGETATVMEHSKQAREQVEVWQWFVKKGGTDPQQVAVRVKVIGITILPRDGT